MTKLEEEIEKLIALKFLTSSTGSFSDRAKRRFEGIRETIAKKLKEKPREPPMGSGLEVRLGWSDEITSWARNISLSLREFEQVNPEAYRQLEEIREKHKLGRRDYLEFSGEVSGDVYIKIIQEIMGDISYEEATQIYKITSYIGDILGKDEVLYRSLLSE